MAASMAGALSRPSAILFDWDNTLVDTWPIIQDALNTTFDTFGKPAWDMDEVKTRVRKSLRESFPEHFGDEWEHAAEVFYARYAAIHLEKLTAAPGAGETLERLSRTGIFLGVVSNKTGSFLRQEAEQLGWNAHVEILVGAMDAARDKPARDPVDMALDGSGAAAGPDVWFVGDADIDMECAANTGCVPVLVRANPPEPGEFTTHPPARHFPDCLSLCKFVESL